jgi:hypothetical protein
MSAGSSTKVGGYAEKRKCSDRQFKISDISTVDEVKNDISKRLSTS